MPFAQAPDNVSLYYEEAGSGPTILFIHEFAGDWRAWEPQIRHFSRYFRCITYSARGFKPSSVPTDPSHYSQDHARDDAIAVLDHLNIESAHLVGLSMGGFAALHVGIRYPKRVRSLVIAGCGYGASPKDREGFRRECEAAAKRFESDGQAAGGKYAIGPTRVQFQNKDQRGWAEFEQQMLEHDWTGQANTIRGVQMQRPSLFELVADMNRIVAPALIVTGDEDDPCLEPSLLMKRSIPTAGLLVVPKSGHTINLEEPKAFNQAVEEFLLKVETRRWSPRDPRSVASGIIGFEQNPRTIDPQR